MISSDRKIPFVKIPFLMSDMVVNFEAIQIMNNAKGRMENEMINLSSMVVSEVVKMDVKAMRKTTPNTNHVTL